MAGARIVALQLSVCTSYIYNQLDKVVMLGTSPPYNHHMCPQGHTTHEPCGQLHRASFLDYFVSFLVTISEGKLFIYLFSYLF